MEQTFKVGEVAEQAGVHVQTLHFYERMGRVPKPKRSAANYRLYSIDAVKRVQFIRKAQAISLTLEEIKDILDVILADGGEGQKFFAERVEFMQSVTPVKDQATAYVCENFVCQLPTPTSRSWLSFSPQRSHIHWQSEQSGLSKESRESRSQCAVGRELNAGLTRSADHLGVADTSRNEASLLLGFAV